MKKASLIFSLAALAVLAVSCNNTSTAPAAEPAQTDSTKGAIVYFNMDRVINEYDMANELSSVVQTKIQSLNSEVNRRGTKLQSDVNSFQEKMNKGLLTSSVAEVQYQKLQQQQQEFENYAAQKQQEMNEEQSVMMNQIADAINTFIQKFNEEKQYAMILSTQGDLLSAPVVTGLAELDITDQIIEGLNAEYLKTKNAK